LIQPVPCSASPTPSRLRRNSITDPELTEALDKVMTEVSHAENRGEPLDVSKIGRATGLSEDDVWDALQYLTSIGYVTPMLPPGSAD
jgi:hypothetical protein